MLNNHCVDVLVVADDFRTAAVRKATTSGSRSREFFFSLRIICRISTVLLIFSSLSRGIFLHSDAFWSSPLSTERFFLPFRGAPVAPALEDFFFGGEHGAEEVDSVELCGSCCRRLLTCKFRRSLMLSPFGSPGNCDGVSRFDITSLFSF